MREVVCHFKRPNFRGSGQSVGITIEYVVDGLHRRIGKKSNGMLEQRLLYDEQSRVVAALSASGEITQFVYGSAGHVPDYMNRNGTAYRILSDSRGSVRLVVDPSTTPPTVAQRLEYDSFGKITVDTNPGFQPFGFAGGLYDPDTGLVRFGVRDYDPETGRWASKDPAMFATAGTNLYEYVLNDPINAIDPLGLDWQLPFTSYCGPGPKIPPGTNGPDEQCKLDTACRKHDECFQEEGLDAGTMNYVFRSSGQRRCDFALCTAAAKALLSGELKPGNLNIPLVLMFACRP